MIVAVVTDSAIFWVTLPVSVYRNANLWGSLLLGAWGFGVFGSGLLLYRHRLRAVALTAIVGYIGLLVGTAGAVEALVMREGADMQGLAIIGEVLALPIALPIYVATLLLVSRIPRLFRRRGVGAIDHTSGGTPQPIS